MSIGGGSKFTLEKTWRGAGTGTTKFNSPGNITIPYGRNSVLVSGQGGTGTHSFATNHTSSTHRHNTSSHTPFSG